MAVALLALVVAMGGFAVAANSAPKGTFTACLKTRTGALRVVSAGKHCRRGESKVTWNQQGPVGATGPTGPTGVAGPTGLPGVKGDAGAPATKLWAAVRANGTKARGSGVASTQRISTGFYEVTFDRDVTQCAFAATLGDPDTLFIPGGQVGAAQNVGGGFSNLPTQVLVATSNSAGASTDLPSFLAVFC
jgi:hypothetical protein